MLQYRHIHVQGGSCVPNPQLRDTILRNYLNDDNRLLTLCNPLFGTNSQNPSDIVFTTLEGTFFSNLKNDLSCLFKGFLLFIAEHQSTINENMPLRLYFYLCEQLKMFLAPRRKDIYRNPPLELPRIRCIVLYDGKEKEKDFRVMRLSDLFGKDAYAPELVVEVYNINYGCHNLLMDNSVPLQWYSQFMHRIDSNKAAGMKQDDAIREATRYCVANNIMADYLSAKEKEVFDMYGFEWNEDDAKAAYIEEGMEKGREEGREEGMNIANLNAIRAMMNKFGISLREAMETLQIPTYDQAIYTSLLNRV